jgi:hypothetical protein
MEPPKDGRMSSASRCRSSDTQTSSNARIQKHEFCSPAVLTLPRGLFFSADGQIEQNTCLISTLVRARAHANRHDDALSALAHIVRRGLVGKPVDGVVLAVPVGSRLRGRTGRWGCRYPRTVLQLMEDAGVGALVVTAICLILASA